MNTSRRQFLKTAAATTTGALVAHSLPALGRSNAEVAVTPSLSLFGYSQVQLLDGPFRRQFDQHHDLFLHLDEDALLKPFRQRTGLRAPGPDMGGWYDNSSEFNEKDNFHGFVPGHSLGQYISGLARAYAITGRSLHRRRSTAWCAPMRRPWTLLALSTWTITCRPTRTTKCAAA